MDGLVFPPVDLATSVDQGKTFIYDVLRKKNIVLTPEEWVRQHLIHFLIEGKQYPKSLMILEDGMKYAGMKKRSDVVVYDRSGGVFLLAECKSPRVKLHQKSMEQLSLYNQHYKARYLALTNGLALMVYRMDYEHSQYFAAECLPDYK
ncbi:MAG: type I restriction enzyme HsdR N-terminal domain-containing protein [Cyclobacteriaceae bacterium]|nr:type I restriction enzyme HsdR N-terminal domain-containing protein [Cyclobacteriaceae bacterium]